jgi:subtilisin family serine protease
MRKKQRPLEVRFRHLQRRVPARAALLAVIVAVVGVVGLRFSLAENSVPESTEPGGLSAAAEAEVAEVNEATEKQIIVRYKPNIVAAEADSSIVSVDAVKVDEIEQLDMKVLEVPKERRQQTIDELNQDPRVEYAEAVGLVKIATTVPNDPEYKNQWSLRPTLVDLLWDKHKGSSDVVVAVADTGINFNHEDLPGDRILPGTDVVNAGDNDPTDEQGHGTMVAGVVAAVSNNAKGVAGVCWSCRIMPIRAITGNGTGTATDSVEGLLYAADNGADIVNMSFGAEGSYQAMEDAIEYAAGKGVIMVSSAMNEGRDVQVWPGQYDQVINVGGTTGGDKMHANSNYGPTVDIASPYTVATTNMEGGYSFPIYGTSFASPTVAGVLAVLKSAFPNATPAQLRDAITSTADPCCDGKINGGRLNAIKAYNKLAGTQNADTTKPSLEVIAPTEGATISGSILMAVSASDNVGVAKVHMRINDGTPAFDATVPYSFTWGTSGSADGPHTLYFTAYDAAGNSTTVARNVTLSNANPDTTKPTVNVTSPAEGATVSGANLQINVTASDANGVAKVQYLQNNAVVSSDYEPPYTFTADMSTTSDGPYQFTVRAFDVNNNQTDVIRNVTVRNTTTPPPNPPNPPNPNPNPKPADINNDGKVNITDLSILLSNWNENTASADLNSSGKVDLTDLSILLTKWTR